MQDHNCGRLFEDYGIRVIQFYAAKDCIADANKIVDDFLTRLARG